MALRRHLASFPRCPVCRWLDTVASRSCLTTRQLAPAGLVASCPQGTGSWDRFTDHGYTDEIAPSAAGVHHNGLPCFVLALTTSLHRAARHGAMYTTRRHPAASPWGGAAGLRTPAPDVVPGVAPAPQPVGEDLGPALDCLGDPADDAVEYLPGSGPVLADALAAVWGAVGGEDGAAAVSCSDRASSGSPLMVAIDRHPASAPCGCSRAAR